LFEFVRYSNDLKKKTPSETASESNYLHRCPLPCGNMVEMKGAAIEICLVNVVRAFFTSSLSVLTVCFSIAVLHLRSRPQKPGAVCVFHLRMKINMHDK